MEPFLSWVYNHDTRSIFHKTELWKTNNDFSNEEAVQLFRLDPVAFQQKADECVMLSLDRVYINEPGCSMRFSRPEPDHQLLWERIQNRESIHEWINPSPS
jgi:hypothetical protein